MLRNWTLSAVASACLAFAAAAEALALETVSVTSSTTTDGNKTDTDTTNDNAKSTIKVKVDDIRKGRSFKDLHIYPPKVEGEPKPDLPDLKDKSGEINLKDSAGNNVQKDGKDVKWKCEQNGNGIHIYTDGEGTGSGEFSFDLVWKAPSFAADKKLGDIRYVFTDNGAVNFDDTDVLGRKNADGSKKDPPTKKGLPIAIVDLKGPSPGEVVACARGAWTTLAAAFDTPPVAGYTYNLLTSNSRNDCGTDSWRVGINNTSDPIPPEWELRVGSFDGAVTTAGGATLSPKVWVPDDSALVGEDFYLVLVMYGPDGDQLAVGKPLRCVIQ